jgi:fumarate reductase flavoprotein subunit
LHQPPGDLEAIRDALAEVMWNDVGILRDAKRLERARRQLGELETQLERTGIDGRDLRFNLSWHDWMNLRNLILVSRAITESALLRENSRGAHYREDFPEAGDLATSEYMCLRLEGEHFAASRQRVQFTRVRPGESLLEEESSAVSMK